MVLEIAIALAQAATQPVTVPIQNPSFEAPVNLNEGPANDPPCAGKYEWANQSGFIPGWVASLHTATSGVGIVQWGCAVPPDGKNVAMLVGGGTLSQDVGVPKKGVYNLTFWVANWFYSYHADYRIAFTIGSKEYCALSGEAFGDFLQVTMPCLLPVSDAVINSGEHLIVSFTNTGGWTLLLDDVSPLTFTPTN